MPQGQIVPSLSMDPATGGIYPPGVIVDDDFSVNRLTSYIPFDLGEITVNMNKANVSNGILTRTGAGSEHVSFRNQRPLLVSRQMVKIVPGSLDQYLVNIFPKIIDTNNFLLLQTYNAFPGQGLMYRKNAGAYTRVDAGNLEAPTPNGGPIWYVSRLFQLLPVSLTNRFRWSIQTFVAPPNIVSVPVTQLTFNLPNIFAQPGYSGLGLGVSAAGINSWGFDEWTIVDDTNRMFF